MPDFGGETGGFAGEGSSRREKGRKRERAVLVWGCKGPNAKSGWPFFFWSRSCWWGAGWRGEGRARVVEGQLIKREDKIKFLDKEKNN